MKIKNVFSLNKFIFMFDYIKGCIPDELKRLFTFIYDIHSYVTLVLLKYLVYMKEILHNLVLIL